MGPFGLGNGAIDGDVIDSLLPLIIEIGAGAYGDYEDCAIGGKVVSLLWRHMDLERRW
jgi:hypothetical protein